MSKQRLERILPFVVMVIAAVAAILAFPYVASAYHLEVGSRDSADPDKAREHLLKAIEWDAKNAQAHRLLAHVYQSQGDLATAAGALERYTALRPRNPLGHSELAQIYEAIEARGLDYQGGLDMDTRIRAEWQQSGATTQDMCLAGESYRDIGRLDEAERWFERALRLEPNLGDTWYYVGLLRESQKQWPEALQAYEQALALDSFRWIGDSNPYYHMGLVYQLRLDPPQLENALWVYETAAVVNDFWPAPDEAWLHVRLGQVLHDLNEDAPAAEREMLKALEIAPHQRWFYLITGDLYRDTGRVADAKAMYEHALLISNDFEAAIVRLEALEEAE